MEVLTNLVIANEDDAVKPQLLKTLYWSFRRKKTMDLILEGVGN